MYRLQLGLKSKVGAAIGICAALTLFYFAPVKLVKEDSPFLALAPLGYTFKDKPFTGIVFQLADGYQLSRLGFVHKGLRQGPDLQWYGNGQRFVERHYDRGLEVGTQKAWFENGSVRSLKHFSNGVAHGEFYDWHSNGQLAQFVVYDQGKEIAAKSWTAGGKPFYNYVWVQNSKVGIEGDTFCSPKKRR